MEKITVEDVEQAAAWLRERGCKAAAVNAPSHAGVVYTQPDSPLAYFAQAGDVLAWDGAHISAQQ